jgi:hypothetical protein
VENELLEGLAPLRHDEQPDGCPPGKERFLDRMPAGDYLLVLAQQVRGRRNRSGTPRPGLPGVLGSEGAAIAASGRPRPEVGAALLIGRSIESRPVELGTRAHFARTRSFLVRRIPARSFLVRSFVCGGFLPEVGLVERRLCRN